MPLFRMKRNLRSGILMTFSALLFFSFAAVAAAFNIAVSQYIRGSAVNQLSNSRVAIARWFEQNAPIIDNATETYIGAVLDEHLQQYTFRIPLSMLVVNSAYEIKGSRLVLPEAITIVGILKSENAPLDERLNRKVRTAHEIYYVVGSNMAITYINEPVYLIVYADVTAITHFASVINLLLFILVTIIWLMSMGIITFLSNSITKPIRALSLFATRIGHGDFMPSHYQFPEIELNNLNHSLNQAAKQLAVYDSEQKTFFQNVSHELRTPLMSIKCYAEGIQYGLMEPLEASRTILNETDRLTEMVDDLLYVSKIDNISSAAALEQIDLNEMICACAAQQAAVAQSRQLRLITQPDNRPLLITCARKHLMRAVNNLISNAIRYAASEITITCRKQKMNIIISVADDGPGIAPEAMPHLFERFYKGDGGNHGIGLSIVKSVAEQHKGTVAAYNAVRGAVFTITLPYTGK